MGINFFVYNSSKALKQSKYTNSIIILKQHDKCGYAVFLFILVYLHNTIIYYLLTYIGIMIINNIIITLWILITFEY